MTHFESYHFVMEVTLKFSILCSITIHRFHSTGTLTTTHGIQKHTTQPVFTCSKLTIETLEQSEKYVQS